MLGSHKSLPEGRGRDGPEDSKELLLRLIQGMEGTTDLILSGFVVGDVAQAGFEPTDRFSSLSLTSACVAGMCHPP